ncbi:MAG TPA: tyrosinase family protein [Thermoanaerobaculia bacterium]|jgi:hypothetical protein
MGLRKSFVRLTDVERDRYLEAVLTLKNTPDPLNAGFSIYDRFVGMHIAIGQIVPPGGGSPIAVGHGNSGFLPWHRKFILEYERALQNVHPDVTLPYWDWTDHAAVEAVLFQDNFMGPNGTGAIDSNGGPVSSGYFAFNAPASLPPWWPSGLPGFRIHSSFTSAALGTTLRRGLGWQYGVQDAPFDALTISSDVTGLLALTTYGTFRSTLEGGVHLHGYIHNWTGGHLRNVSVSPNDPLFFMHHANIDRLWAMWQVNDHGGAANYTAGPAATLTATTDLVWPWVGAAAYSDPILDGIGYAMASFPATTYGDLLDHRALGYSYDTEVAIGIALDQSFSMTGSTPIAVSGSPNLTKWEAAKLAVGNLLHDCNAALASGAAYVTGGVQTFTTNAAGTVNQFTSVFAPPTGIIRDGTPHSEAQFNTNAAALAPIGGTPIAGALTSTETSIVRAPFVNQPAGETRFLYFLTDGLETAPPPLSSLAFHQFPDTLIFAMGFGMGGGWDGVDYTAIHDIVSKGKTPPPAVPHHFMGDDLPSLDKFFTDSLAAALGYSATIDPIYELFPGEYVDTELTVTTADSSFLIACLGYDFDDDHWRFELIAPSGATFDASSTSPYEITFSKRNGRATIFLARNAATAAEWCGTWRVRAAYKMREERARLDVTDWMLLTPTGAHPVRGPVYGRLAQSPKERAAVRTIPAPVKSIDEIDQFGVMTAAAGACTVSVNIYDRGLLSAFLLPEKLQLFAGDEFRVALRVADRSGHSVDTLRVDARLVAPAHNLGDAFADARTIPAEARRKYIAKKKGFDLFDEARFLADYEQARPGAFAVRDERLRFEESGNGFTATIRDNRFPGVYHVSALIEGVWRGPSGRPEPFRRLLKRSVGVGLRIDPEKSRAVATRTRGGLSVGLTLRDVLGNVAVPTRLRAARVHADGKLVESARGVDASEARLDVPVDKKKEPRALEVEIGGVRIPVKIE